MVTKDHLDESTFIHPLLAVDDLAIELVHLHCHVLAGLGDGDAQVLLDVGQHLLVIVPHAAAAVGRLAGVPAVAAAGLAPLTVVPDLNERLAMKNIFYKHKNESVFTFS